MLMLKATLTVLFAGGATAAAMGQAGAQDGSSQLDAVIGCRAEPIAASRLACFDRTVATLGRARDEKKVIVLDRNAVVARKQRQFGLGSPSVGATSGDEAEQQTAVVNLDTTVRRATPAAGMAGRWNLALANGMVWQTLEDLGRTPTPGTAIQLRRASLGGYRAFIGKQRGIPVKRVR